MEKEYYEAVRKGIEALFGRRGKTCYFEITSEGLSEKLKGHIPKGREIVLSFLSGSVKPDIVGLIEEEYRPFVVVEVKEHAVKLDDIYQARKYADLLEAKFTFLVSLQQIPEQIKRLVEATSDIVNFFMAGRMFNLVHFDTEQNQFLEWIPDNPFEKEYLFK